MDQISSIILQTNEEKLENIISPFIREQFPNFIREDYSKLVLFIKAYYEWLEKEGNAGYVLSKLDTVSDVDENFEQFYKHFKNTYTASFPELLAVDTDGNVPNKKTLLKKIRDFYGNKGTESSYKFLFRILYDSDLEFYYPKTDILKASDGQWTEPRSIKTTSVNGKDLFGAVNGELQQFGTNGALIATAFIDSVVQYTFAGLPITEFFIRDIGGSSNRDPFIPNTTVRIVKTLEDGTVRTWEESVYSVLGSFDIEVPGEGYLVGDTVTVVDDEGQGFQAKVDQIGLAGAVKRIGITNSGINYKSNRLILDIFNERGGRSAVVVGLRGAVTNYPGYFSGNRGKPSVNKRVQDGHYYQDFSYVLKSEVSLNTYFDVLRRLVHPSGMRMFGSILLKGVIQNTISSSSQMTVYENPFIGEYTPYTFRTFTDLRDMGFLPNQVRGATLQVWLSTYTVDGNTSAGVTAGWSSVGATALGVNRWIDLARGVTYIVPNGSSPDPSVWSVPRAQESAINTHQSLVFRPVNDSTSDFGGGNAELRSYGYWGGVTVGALGLSGARSYFVVAKARTLVPYVAPGQHANDSLIADTGAWHGVAVGACGDDGLLKAYTWNYKASNQTSVVLGTAGRTGEWFMLSSVFSGTPSANGALSLFCNGVCLGTEASAFSPGANVAGTSLGIGMGANLDSVFDGEIAEVVCYQGDVGTLDRQKVEGYLAHKYNLDSKLPSTHPYKTVAPGVSYSSGTWYGATGDLYPNGYNPFLASTGVSGPDGTFPPTGSLFYNSGLGYTYTVANEFGSTAHNPAGAPLGGVTSWLAGKEQNYDIGTIPGMVLWLKPENIGVCGAKVNGASADVWVDASPSKNDALPPNWSQWNGLADVVETAKVNNWSKQVYDSTNPVTKVVFTPSGLCGGFTTGRLFMMGLNSDPATNASFTSIDYAWYSEGTYESGQNYRKLVIYEDGQYRGVIQDAPTGNFSYFDNAVLEVEYEEPNVVYRLNGKVKRTVYAGYNKTFYLDSSFYSSAAGVTGTSVTIKELSYKQEPVLPVFTSSAGLTAFAYGRLTVDKLRPQYAAASGSNAEGLCFNGGVLYSSSTIWNGTSLGNVIPFGGTYGNGSITDRIMSGQHMTLKNPLRLPEDADIFMVVRPTQEGWNRGLGLAASLKDLSKVAVNDTVLFHRSYNEIDRDPVKQTDEYYKILSSGQLLYPGNTPTGLVGFRPAGSNINASLNTLAYDPHVSGVCLGTQICEWARKDAVLETYLNADPAQNYSRTTGRRIAAIATSNTDNYTLQNGMVFSIDGSDDSSKQYSAYRDKNLYRDFSDWKETPINILKPIQNWVGDGGGSGVPVNPWHPFALGQYDPLLQVTPLVNTTVFTGFSSTIPTRQINTSLNYNGTQTAGTISGSGWLAYTSAITENGYRYLTSWYLKAGANTTTVSFTWGGAHNGNRTDLVFNLVTGTFTGQTIAAGEQYGSESLGNGWHRIWYTSTLWSGNAYYPQLNNGNGTVLFGGIKIQSLSHSNPNAYWRRDGSYRITPGSSGNIYLTSLFPSSPTHWNSFTSKIWTFSALVRRADGGVIPSMSAYIHSTPGGSSHVYWAAPATVTGVGNGWYRISVTKTITAATSVFGEVPTLVGFSGLQTGTTYYIAEAQLLPYGTGYVSGINGRRTSDFPTVDISSFISDSIVWDTNPWSDSELVWDMKNHEVSRLTWNGGFNGNTVTVDPTKTYRFSVWLNRRVAGRDGTFYFGTRGGNAQSGFGLGVLNASTGTDNTNPYFTAFDGNHPYISGRIGQWVLVVGHIHPAGTVAGTVHPDSGIYHRSGNGNTYAPVGDFIWKTGTEFTNLRAYLFYCSDRTVHQQFLRPRIDLVDGTEPSVDDLLNNRENTVRDNSVFDNSAYALNSPKWVNEAGGAFHFAQKDDKMRSVQLVNIGNSGNVSWEAAVWDDPSTRSIDYKGSMFMGMGGLPYFRSISNANGSGGQLHLSAAISGVQRNLYSPAIPDLRPYAWHHVAFTMEYDFVANLTHAKIYFNGRLVARTTTIDDPNPSLRPWTGKHSMTSGILTLGGRVNGPDRPSYAGDGSGYPFIGKVAYARVYNRTLNLEEVSRNYSIWSARFLRSVNV